MKELSYIITTNTGVIPNVINPKEHSSLSKHVKLYLDDFLFKDSFYDLGGELSLKEFCKIDEKIALGFKNTPKVLTSKRGNYKLTKEAYEKVLGIMKPDYYSDYDTGKLSIEKKEVVEPKDLETFCALIKTEGIIVGTGFIHKLVEEKKMLKLMNNKIEETNAFDCDCCGDLSPGYLEYLCSINEMNAGYYLTVHNFNFINDLFTQINLGKLEADKIELNNTSS